MVSGMTDKSTAVRYRRSGHTDYLATAVKAVEPEITNKSTREVDGKIYTVTEYADDYAAARAAWDAQDYELYYLDMKNTYRWRDPNRMLYGKWREHFGSLDGPTQARQDDDLENQPLNQ
jgi:hypothetical protein